MDAMILVLRSPSVELGIFGPVKSYPLTHHQRKGDRGGPRGGKKTSRSSQRTCRGPYGIAKKETEKPEKKPQNVHTKGIICYFTVVNLTIMFVGGKRPGSRRV